MSIARGSDAIVIIVNNEKEREIIESVLKNNYIRQESVAAKSGENRDDLKEKIWRMLGLMVIYTKKTKTPMALRYGSTIKDFAARIHKDFIANFRFARISRNGRIIQAGINYRLQDGDIVELHMQS